ncbi:MAG: acetylglutamate kinase [Anaerolineae bacterium]|nr:acetylglutamate kinase [Anaerolineae bacterium]
MSTTTLSTPPSPFAAPPVLLKIGGNDIDNPDFLRDLAAYVAALDRPAVIVHGGGKEIGQLQAALGIVPQWVDGLRVTDEATLAVVEMVLCGGVNKRLVRQLIAAGVEAQGLSGTDRGLLRGVRLQHPGGDLGRVGTITAVRADVLLGLLAADVTPVIAPLALGEDGGAYNVNADHAAAAIAEAIGAARIVFLTNVSAVLVDGRPQPSLSLAQAQALIASGVISGGMIPKVQTALHAVALGIPQAVITDLAGLQSGGGTVFHSDASPLAAAAASAYDAASASAAAR